jgi:hypothetical protein
VTTAKLADNSVTTRIIADGQVTTAKLAANSVTSSIIADGQVTAAKLSGYSSATKVFTAPATYLPALRVYGLSNAYEFKVDEASSSKDLVLYSVVGTTYTEKVRLSKLTALLDAFKVTA